MNFNSIERYKGIPFNPVTVLSSDGKCITYTEFNIKLSLTNFVVKFLRVTRSS